MKTKKAKGGSKPKEIEAFRPRKPYTIKLALANDANFNKSEIINRCLDRSLDAVMKEIQGEQMAAFDRLINAK